VGPHIGRYRVNLQNLSTIGASSLRNAVESAEIIVIDEIGPMELLSPEFRRAVELSYESSRPILAVVHERMKDPVIELLKNNPGTKIVNVTLESRDKIADALAKEIINALDTLKR
jgi:nucleoside-triphosphatase